MASLGFTTSCRADSSFKCACSASVSEKDKSENTTNNTTVVKWSISAIYQCPYWFSGTSRPTAGYLTLKINGTTVFGSYVGLNYGMSNGDTIASGSGEITVKHDDDGTKVCKCEMILTTGGDWTDDPNRANPPYFWGSGSDSTYIALTTVNRYSVISSLSNFNFEDGVSIKYHDYLADKALTLTLSSGDIVITTKTATSVVGDHTVDIVFTAAELQAIYTLLGPTKQSVDVTALLETDSIEVSSTKKVTGSLSPTVNAPEATYTIEEASLSPIVEVAGDTEFVAVIGKKMISVTPVAKNGADITNVWAVVDSVRTILTENNGVFSGIVTGFTSNQISLLVKDSRGLEKGITITGTYKAYVKPSITGVVFERTNYIDDSGHISPTGLVWDGSIGNTPNAVKWRYTLSGTPSNLINGIKSGANWNGNANIASGLTITETFTAIVVAIDAYGQESNEYQVTLAASKPSVWIGKETIKATGVIAEHWIGFYKIGDLFLTLDTTNPSDRFGGTWQLISQGRVLIGAGTSGNDDNGETATFQANDEGGEFYHTLTTSEMPAHKHTTSETGKAQNISSGSGYTVAVANNYGGDAPYATGSAGGGNKHNNMQPYLAVYIWKKTA